MRIAVRVPATSANLGPGFDCLGLALRLYNEVTLDTDADAGVSWEGEGAEELPTDGSDMVSDAIRVMAALRDVKVPAFHLHGSNGIPLQRGLGSSSAAVVAGVLLGDELCGYGMNRMDLFARAAAIEGHPDNAAPCTLGGFTIAGDPESAPSVHLDPHPDIHPVALIPDDFRVPTSEARRALPDAVRLQDAVANLRATALGVVAFTQDPSLLEWALADRIHQDVRLALVPEVRAAFQAVGEARIPVCVSGAGPTLMAFPSQGQEVPDPGQGWRVVPLEADLEGAKLLPVP